MSFLSKVDDWFENCGRAKRAKNGSPGTDRRTFLKGLGLAGGAVATGGLLTTEAGDVFFEGEEPDGLPEKMEIPKASASGATVASFTSTGNSWSFFCQGTPNKLP